jgi:hypothetical protein
MLEFPVAGTEEVAATEFAGICGTAGDVTLTAAGRGAGTFEVPTLGWLAKAAFAPESTETVLANGAPEFCFEKP